MIERSSTFVSSYAAHAVAVVLVGVTAVLLCFGALVTTYDAAMAVPDWPGTYGHNMFLFPISEWLVGGPWDLFLEHGHRLLGATVGLLSLILAAACFRWETRGVVRGLAMLSRPRDVAMALALRFVGWLGPFASGWLVARSLGIDLGFAAAAFVIAVIGLGSAIPSSPGMIGAYQWLAVTSMAVVGVGQADALAFSIISRATWYTPVTLMGPFAA